MDLHNMASASHTVEDTLTTAQRALEDHYGNSYPSSIRVQQSLRELLNQKFDGSHKSFTEKFLRPTTLLLEQLKAEGFPLVKDGRVILHLSAPINHLEVGEMFFQVGHTTPGTLTLKFAKLRSNTVFLQPSIIGEIEYHLAFTQKYLQQLRREAGTSGNNLMQLLVVSTVNGQDCATEKIEVKRIMPYSFGHSINNTPSSASDHPVNNGTLSYRQPEENSDLQPVEHSFDDCTSFFPLANSSTTLMNTNRKYREQPSDPSVGNNIVYPTLLQAAFNLPSPNSNEQFQENCSSTTVFDYNPAYSPLFQAERDQSTQKRIDHHPQTENFSKTSNPPYPPVHQATNDQPIPDETARQPEKEQFSDTGEGKISIPLHTQAVRDQQMLTDVAKQPLLETSSGTSANNPSYPPTYQVVKGPTASKYNDSRLQQEHFLGVVGSNPQDPLVHQTLNDQLTHVEDSEEPTQQEKYLSTSENSPSYSPAVRDQPTTSDISRRPLDEKLSSGVTRKNPPYPLIHRAVSDQGTPVTDQQENSSSAGGNNPQYPPIHRAVRDQPNPETKSRRPFEEELSPNGGEKNPSYPSIHRAVSHQSTTDRSAEEPTLGACGSNPLYPPIHQAVRDQTTPEDTGQLLFKEEPPSGGEERNPSYPSIHQAVSNQGTQDTGQRGNNPPYSPTHQAVRDQTRPEYPGLPLFKEEPPSSGEERNPSYPSIHQEVSDRGTIDNGQHEHSSGVGASNPQYPQIHQAVKDELTTEDMGQQRFKKKPSSDGRENNPSYPSIHQAVSDQCATHNGEQEHSSGAVGDNPQYPPVRRAVRDQPTSEDVDQQPSQAGQSPDRGEENPSHPSIYQAITNQRITSIVRREHSSGAGANNAQYPPIHRAVREPTPEDTDKRPSRKEHSSDSREKNPSYPPTHQEVDDACKPHAGHLRNSLGNPSYPPVHEAVSDQPTPDISDHQHSSNVSGPDPFQRAPRDQNTKGNAGHQNARAQVTGAVGNNPTYVPAHAVASVSAFSAQTGENNPTYLPPQAIRSVSVNSTQSGGKNPTYLPPQALRSTSASCAHTKSDQVSSDAGRSDSSYSNSRNSATAIPITDPYWFFEDEECQF